MSKIKRCGTIKESTLVAQSFRKLCAEPSVEVCCDVPVLGRIVDLAYLKGGFIVTIEFKLRDWRKAVVQARDHLLGSDYAYICMPKRRISEKFREELGRVGVGLMFYREDDQWPFEEVIKAPPSQETWGVARTWVMQYIEENKGKDLWRKTRGQ
jgi:hypothetical protein